eukprot:SAG31_NODE_9452_length_1275_cov_0.869048_2_plen_211_part_00
MHPQTVVQSLPPPSASGTHSSGAAKAATMASAAVVAALGGMMLCRCEAAGHDTSRSAATSPSKPSDSEDRALPAAGHTLSPRAATELERLRVQLTPLRVGQLKRQARQSGMVMDGAIDDADDAEDPKAALLDMMLDARRAELAADAAQRPAAFAAADSERLRQQWAPLRLKALKQTAIERYEIAVEAVAGVDDFDDPKAQIISLLLDAHR